MASPQCFIFFGDEKKFLRGFNLSDVKMMITWILFTNKSEIVKERQSHERRILLSKFKITFTKII